MKLLREPDEQVALPVGVDGVHGEPARLGGVALCELEHVGVVLLVAGEEHVELGGGVELARDLAGALREREARAPVRSQRV